MDLSRVIDEIKRIPPDRLSEIYSFIHFFRLGLELASTQRDTNPWGLTGNTPSAATYDFSDLAGCLTWQGNAISAQRAWRDEW